MMACSGRPGARMARTPLLRSLRALLRLAQASTREASGPHELGDGDGGPPAAELVEMARAGPGTRRRFLQGTALAPLALAAGPLLRSGPVEAARREARVAIVGGGLAGLSAAFWLKQRGGIRAPVYEAAGRLGGRCYTQTDLMGPGLTTEIGGEFIDMDHVEMLRYAVLFNLTLIDVDQPSERALIQHLYCVDGLPHGPQEVLEQFMRIIPQVRRDRAA